MANPKQRVTYDPEKFSVNTAWMRKGGEHFEVVIEPDNALEFKRTKGATPDIRECLHAERVFTDAKRGEHATDVRLETVFGTKEPLDVAKKLIIEGDIQLTAEHRAKIREAKLNAILTRIQQYAIDPKSGLPHPRMRLELAFDQAKIKIDEKKDIDEQIPLIIRELQPIIPIRLETVTLQVHLPSQYSEKLVGTVRRHGQLKKEEWLSDGSWMGWVELPAGMQMELFDDIGKKTHGGAEIKKVSEERREFSKRSQE